MVRLIAWLLVVVIIALIVLFAAILYRRYSLANYEREKILAEERWTGDCQFDNPFTGAKCQRQEFHIENHYRDINGKLEQW